MTKFRAACVQLCSSDSVTENVRIASELIRQAHGKGAQFIATPENTSLMAPGSEKVKFAASESADRALPAFRDLAEELGVWLLVGSLPIKVSEAKTANRSFLINPKGEIAVRYDKLHLFDVDLPSGESHRESSTVEPGRQAVTAALPWGKLGLSVCYDLRFPQLYRALAHAGAFAFTIPSAFTVETGEAHWHVLLRARAIENGAFVIAPAQGGKHANGRATYGHSLIVSPWGEVIAEAGTEPCVIVADIDPSQSADARARIPALLHDRPFQMRPG